MLTQAGSETFWDRSTLYALRGVYACGETEKATDYLRFYSSQRLLGEHVPYAIEAWPEGNQRHLSAESGLYCRIITEGMFGIRPTGLNSFVFTPRLPQEWDHMNLRKICAFNQVFDIEVKRLGDQLQVAVIADGKTISNRKIKEGEIFGLNLGVAFERCLYNVWTEMYYIDFLQEQPLLKRKRLFAIGWMLLIRIGKS